MTVTSSQSIANYQGNGATTVWPFPFFVPAAVDLVVKLVSTTTGVITTLSPSIYSVLGIGDANGGSITYPLIGSPITSTQIISIQRVVPLEQNAVIENQSPFLPNVLEGALDYEMLAIQQVDSKIGFSIRAPASDLTALLPLPPASLRALQALTFDSLGNPTVGKTTGASVSAALQPVVAAGSIAEAAALLGLGGISGVVVNIAGTANAITGDIFGFASPVALKTGSNYNFIPLFANTSAVFANFGGAGSVEIKKASPTGAISLTGGEIRRGVSTLVIYNGVNLLIIGPEAPLMQASTSAAAASTTDLGAVGNYNIQLTGNVGIQSFGSSAAVGDLFRLTFAGSLVITYNAVSMILPGATDLFAKVGDRVWVTYLGAGAWRVVNYVPFFPASTGIGGAKGLMITNNAVTPNTKIDITILEGLTVQGSAYYPTAAFTINALVNGANGLDVGSLAANTWYYVWALTNTVGILSLSSTAPTLPTGYSGALRLGAVFTTVGSVFKNFIICGQRFRWKVDGVRLTGLPTINRADTGSTSTPVYTAFSVALFVPPTASTISLLGTFVSAAGNGVMIVAPNGSYDNHFSLTNPPPMILFPLAFSVGINAGAQALEMVLESANIFIASSLGATRGALFAQGFIDTTLVS